MIDALKLASAIDALEEKYDELLGGSDTRPWREMLVFATSQITKTGCDVGDVMVFLLEFVQLASTTPAGEGRPS